MKLLNTFNFPNEQTESTSSPGTPEHSESPPESRTLLAYTILSPAISTPMSAGLSPHKFTVTTGADPLTLPDLRETTEKPVECEASSGESNENLKGDDKADLRTGLAVNPKDSLTSPVNCSDDTQENVTDVELENSGEPKQVHNIDELTPEKGDSITIEEEFAVKNESNPVIQSSIPVMRHPKRVNIEDDVFSGASSVLALDEELGNGEMPGMPCVVYHSSESNRMTCFVYHITLCVY